MIANVDMSESESFTAESIMLRAIEESLPDLWIVSTEPELDIRDAVPDEEYMLEWHYPGKCNVEGIVPELNVTESRTQHALATQVPRSQLVARGILSGGRTMRSDY